LPKKRILISDNSKDFVRLLVEFFSKQPDIEIVGVAYDGTLALEMIEKTKPDILLLDIIMPELDGLEVMKYVYEKGIKLQIYVVSAVGNEQISKMAIEYGTVQYFIKPIDLNEILKAILEKRQAL
jgi:two-component system response regulator (stage 0 sporulation protein A)